MPFDGRDEPGSEDTEGTRQSKDENEARVRDDPEPESLAGADEPAPFLAGSAETGEPQPELQWPPEPEPPAAAEAPRGLEIAAETPILSGASLVPIPPAEREAGIGAVGGGKQRREERERPRAPRGPRPDLVSSTEPVYRDRGGYRMRIEPADLARLRELPGSKGKTDRELGETFFDGQSERFVTSLAEDVPAPADVRVVVDPYSRQAFLAVERKIRSILSF